MAQRGQIVVLSSVVIPPENTPEKLKSASLVAHPLWKYIGPACTINLEWQIGKWNSTFDGITARKYDTRSQPASSELKEFTTDLTAIPLSALSPGYHDCEIWFKDSFSDLRIIVQNCVKIAELPQALQVIVALKNPPSGATLWTVKLLDWDVAALIHFVGWDGKDILDINEEATFEIPSGLKFPLRFMELQISKWNEAKTALVELFYMQSWRPYLWDWDKGGYGDEPDPTYREIFIPEAGSYYLDVATIPAVKIAKVYVRSKSPTVSPAYSGWIEVAPIGGPVNPHAIGYTLQIGVLLQNPTKVPLKYNATIYNYSSSTPTMKNYLTMPSVEPVAVPPAPTGLPYSSYAYECDMFLPPGGTLPPGKTGFVYCDYFEYDPSCGYAFYINIKSGTLDLGTKLLFGWPKP